MSLFDNMYTDTLRWRTAPRRGVSAGYPVGNITSNGSRVLGYKGVKYMVHRLVWEFHNGAIPEGMEIDHIDNNRVNNSIENVRLATRSQNGMNHPIHKNNSTGHKNIGTRQRGNCLEYKGQITCNGELYTKSSIYLEVVQQWLETKRAELHGEFSNAG